MYSENGKKTNVPKDVTLIVFFFQIKVLIYYGGSLFIGSIKAKATNKTSEKPVRHVQLFKEKWFSSACFGKTLVTLRQHKCLHQHIFNFL